MSLPRRTLLTLALFAALTGVGGGVAQAAPDDKAMGNPKAKVTMIEYASVTCPHCAHWNATVFPAFKKKYVDTGRVRFVLRELPTPPFDAAVAGFLVARCSGPKYFEVVDALWRAQPAYIDSGDTRTWLLAGAGAGGLTEPQVQACLENTAAIEALTSRSEANAREYDVQGTPTFVVNGRKLEGDVDLASLDAAITGTGKVRKGPMTFFKGLFKKRAH